MCTRAALPFSSISVHNYWRNSNFNSSPSLTWTFDSCLFHTIVSVPDIFCQSALWQRALSATTTDLIPSLSSALTIWYVELDRISTVHLSAHHCSFIHSPVKVECCWPVVTVGKLHSAWALASPINESNVGCKANENEKQLVSRCFDTKHLIKGKLHQLYTFNYVCRSLWSTITHFKQVAWSLLWLQRKLCVMKGWKVVASDVTHCLSCIVGNVGSRFFFKKKKISCNQKCDISGSAVSILLICV